VLRAADAAGADRAVVEPIRVRIAKNAFPRRMFSGKDPKLVATLAISLKGLGSVSPKKSSSHSDSSRNVKLPSNPYVSTVAGTVPLSIR
jgi:hypothetical protein